MVKADGKTDKNHRNCMYRHDILKQNTVDAHLENGIVPCMFFAFKFKLTKICSLIELEFNERFLKL